jgi:hypothetical protein
VTLPPPIQLTNLDEISTIHRNADQTLKWNPAGYPHSMTATARLAFYNPFFTGPSVTCRVAASDGQMILPTALLQVLPSGSTQYQLQISIAPRADGVRQFAIPLADGTTLPSILRYLSSETIPVVIQ